MVFSRTFIAERHKLLQLRVSALLDATRSDGSATRQALRAFFEALEAHIALDVHLGYRLLMQEKNVERRISIVKMLEEQGGFSMHLDTFARRWKDADDAAVRSALFLEDLEAIVELLMRRIKTEQRVVALVADIA